MNEEIIDNTHSNDVGNLKVTNSIRKNLDTSSKWGLFLAIMGYIGLGFMLLAVFMLLSIGNRGFRGEEATVMAIVYLVLIVVYFFPIFYLNKFSSNIKKAISGDDQLSFEEGIKYLAMQYKFMGILTIVIISLYILMIFFAIALGPGRF